MAYCARKITRLQIDSTNRELESSSHSHIDRHCLARNSHFRLLRWSRIAPLRKNRRSTTGLNGASLQGRSARQNWLASGSSISGSFAQSYPLRREHQHLRNKKGPPKRALWSLSSHFMPFSGRMDNLSEPRVKNHSIIVHRASKSPYFAGLPENPRPAICPPDMPLYYQQKSGRQSKSRPKRAACTAFQDTTRDSGGQISIAIIETPQSAPGGDGLDSPRVQLHLHYLGTERSGCRVVRESNVVP